MGRSCSTSTLQNFNPVDSVFAQIFHILLFYVTGHLISKYKSWITRQPRVLSQWNKCHSSSFWKLFWIRQNFIGTLQQWSLGSSSLHIHRTKWEWQFSYHSYVPISKNSIIYYSITCKSQESILYFSDSAWISGAFSKALSSSSRMSPS